MTREAKHSGAGMIRGFMGTVGLVAVLLAVAAPAAQAKGVTSTAVARAVAFWAPYNAGMPICPNGVKIHQVSSGETPGPSFVRRWSDTGELLPQCEMFADPSISYLPIADQCAWVARNIGWSFMGLPNSTDPRNVMYNRRWVTPAACHTHQV